MDKKLLKNILGYVAAGLGVLAFIMIFLKAVGLEIKGTTFGYKGSEIAFGSKDLGLNFNFLALIAYLLPLAGGVVAIFAGLKNKPVLNWVAAALFLVGAILLFLMPAYWDLFVVKEFKEDAKELKLDLLIGAILAAIFAILGAVACFAKNFIKEEAPAATNE